ncbi:MAG: S-methyl-5-thioribose-1-phosphate isomerase [Phycisphaerales bacterium]|nr:S-methyl-5-thioribose-1-phosphate isomerase [Phycisphaerales bacterium]
MTTDTELQTIELGDIGGEIRILDQTLLPFQVEHRTLASWEEAAEAIKVMRVRGAPLIGATAACGMALAIRSDPSDAAMFKAADGLRKTRPTAVNLQWAVERCLSILACTKPEHRLEVAWKEAALIIAEDKAANRAIGEYGVPLIKALAEPLGGEPVRILTHCNAGWLATTHLGTATAPIYLAHAQGIPVHVLVDETRPRSQGAALTAWELERAGVPCDVIADNAGGLLMQRGEVHMVITGADRVAANGDVCNKIGTYLKALAARESGVPFCVSVPTSTIDPAMADGFGIPIEDRGPDEVLHATGLDPEGTVRTIRTAAEGVSALNPAFDITPAGMVTTLITERGLIKPQHAGHIVG